MKGTVHSCTRRRDDKFLIVIRRPGAIEVSGIANEPIREGADCRIVDGKAFPDGR